jgi:hypothetical protein
MLISDRPPGTIMIIRDPGRMKSAKDNKIKKKAVCWSL